MSIERSKRKQRHLLLLEGETGTPVGLKTRGIKNIQKLRNLRIFEHHSTSHFLRNLKTLNKNEKLI